MRKEKRREAALCEVCKDFKKRRRNGCVETKGKLWFLKRFTKFEVCPIYECITNKKISRCIDCKNSLVKYFWNGIIRELDSSEVRSRIGSLFLRKKVGTKKWKEILIEYEDSEK